MEKLFTYEKEKVKKAGDPDNRQLDLLVCKIKSLIGTVDFLWKVSECSSLICMLTITLHQMSSENHEGGQQ